MLIIANNASGFSIKCIEFVPYTVEFADGSGREDSFLRLYGMFLLLK